MGLAFHLLTPKLIYDVNGKTSVDVEIAINVHNRRGNIMYYKLTITDQDGNTASVNLGSVDPGQSTKFVVSVSLPVPTLTTPILDTNWTIKLEEYSDSTYTTLNDSGETSLPVTFIDSSQLTLLDEDDFEVDFEGWTAQIIDGSGSLVRRSTPVYSGSYSLQSINGGTFHAKITKTLTVADTTKRHFAIVRFYTIQTAYTKSVIIRDGVSGKAYTYPHAEAKWLEAIVELQVDANGNIKIEIETTYTSATITNVLAIDLVQFFYG